MKQLINFLEKAKDLDFYQVFRVIEEINCSSCNSILFLEELTGSRKNYKFKYQRKFRPNTSILQVKYSDEKNLELVLSFSLLLGERGALPSHYIENAILNKDFDRKAFFDFLTIFDARFIEYFYFSFQKNTIYSLSHYKISKNSLSDFISSLCGNIRKSNLIFNYYSGFFLNTVRSKSSLQKILCAIFPISVHINEFLLNRISMENPYCLGIGDRKFAKNILLGELLLDIKGSFCIEIIFNSYNDLLSFMPPSKNFKKLKLIIHSYLGLQFRIYIKFILHKNLIPDSNLNLYLAWNSWIRSKPTNTIEVDSAILAL